MQKVINLFFHDVDLGRQFLGTFATRELAEARADMDIQVWQEDDEDSGSVKVEKRDDGSIVAHPHGTFHFVETAIIGAPEDPKRATEDQIAWAESIHGQDDDRQVQIDGDALVSETDDPQVYWVQAWVRVDESEG